MNLSFKGNIRRGLYCYQQFEIRVEKFEKYFALFELNVIKCVWKDICSLDRWSSKAMVVVGKEARPTKIRQCQFHC
ncbi:hypothetical protein T4A_2980 [Trichinella pseudospiralis]|uniref:Uncharacterized protein n=1 Tax=Trichinella pseudospiralis TaxID=6337 RepID=A0A0V1E0R0_TRIPS|nr:hypothetical protein T4A_2980 [Trichinella pseudospiralis]